MKFLIAAIRAAAKASVFNDYNPTGVSDEESVEFIVKIVENTFLNL